MNFIFGSSSQKIDTRYEFIKKTLGNKLFTISNKDTFIINANDLVKLNIQPYWGQRAKDELHINTISNGIKISNMLFHPIILAHIVPKQDYYSLDGQHRLMALLRLSPTQRNMINIQVDVLNYEVEDDKWILQQYEYINTSKGISKVELDNEQNISLLVDECSKKFGNIGGGYKLIDEFSIKNKQNSRLVKSKLKEELLKRYDRLKDVDVVEKIYEYNTNCHNNFEGLCKGSGIGKKTKQECIDRKFWIGVNFPQWLDQVFI